MRIAVTGGIAEGKSTVLGYLREMGYQTASADVMAREVFLDETVQSKLSDLIGCPAPVSAELLRERIAEESSIRRKLNRIMHPLIINSLTSSRANFVEVPLLFETALQPLFERVWVVTCGEQIQLQRLSARVGNVQDAKAMIGTQLATQIKCAFADEIIRTDATEESVKAIVQSAISREFAK